MQNGLNFESLALAHAHDIITKAVNAKNFFGEKQIN